MYEACAVTAAPQSIGHGWGAPSPVDGDGARGFRWLRSARGVHKAARMMRAALFAAAIVTSGCLTPFPNDPTGGSAAGTTTGGGDGTGGAAGGGAIGGGGSGGGDGTGASAGDLGAPADGAVAGGGDLAGAPAADMATSCIKLTSPPDSGHHNAGDACLSCHNGGKATLFTFAGMLYNAAVNGSAIAGATIEVIDAKGTTARIVTSSNGNFYTSTALTPPFTTRASGCPNNAAMVGKATGDCNSSGCHTSAMRIHLP